MILYLRSRRVVLAASLMVLLALACAVAGTAALTVIQSGEPVRVAYFYLLQAFAAAIAVTSLATPVPLIDLGDTGPVRRAQWLHLAALTLVGAVLMGLAETPLGTEGMVEAVRSYLGWYGVALVGAAWVRDTLAWVGTLVGIGVIVFLGSPGGVPAAWNWGMARAGEPVSWCVAGALLAAGLLSQLHRWTRIRLSGASEA